MELKREGVTLDFLIFSEKRKNLLLLLRNGSKTLPEIRDSLKVTSSGIIPEIRKMEDRHLLLQTGRKINLTEIGEVLADHIYHFEGILKVFSQDPKYWNEHKISGIPHEFRIRLHELGNYEIIKGIPTDIFKPHEEIMKNLEKAMWIKGVLPVLNPEYIDYVLDFWCKGKDVSIIIQKELLERIEEKYGAKLEKCCKNTCLMVCDEKIEVDLSVTDFFLSMRLFRKDDAYDFNQNLESFEKSALAWGEELFGYYERRSRKVIAHDV